MIILFNQLTWSCVMIRIAFTSPDTFSPPVSNFAFISSRATKLHFEQSGSECLSLLPLLSHSPRLSRLLPDPNSSLSPSRSLSLSLSPFLSISGATSWMEGEGEGDLALKLVCPSVRPLPLFGSGNRSTGGRRGVGEEASTLFSFAAARPLFLYEEGGGDVPAQVVAAAAVAV